MKKIMLCGSKETKRDIISMNEFEVFFKQLGFKVFNPAKVLKKCSGDSVSNAEGMFGYFHKHISNSDFIFFLDNHIDSDDCYLESQIAYKLNIRSVYTDNIKLVLLGH